MTHITPGQVKTIIANEYEAERACNEAAEEIAALCHKHAGQMITERNKPAGWHIVKHYGWTALQTDAYFYDRMAVKQGGPLVDLIMDRREVYAAYPKPDALREVNTSYFAAALERQAARLELLADPAKLRAIARSLNDVHKALAAVREALPSAPPRLGGVPDRYQIIRGADLGEVKVGRLQL